MRKKALLIIGLALMIAAAGVVYAHDGDAEGERHGGDRIDRGPLEDPLHR